MPLMTYEEKKRGNMHMSINNNVNNVAGRTTISPSIRSRAKLILWWMAEMALLLPNYHRSPILSALLYSK